MSSDLPLVWLCGPPGVGKTAVAWAVYTRLNKAGVRAAYVDVDQLGMCNLEQRDDPARHRLKSCNVQAVRDNFADAGAAGLIVSGAVDPERGPEIDSSDLQMVGRLRADADRLIARLRARRASFADPGGAVRKANLLDASTFADWVLDTTASSIEEVADEVLRTVGRLFRREDSRLGEARGPARDNLGESTGGEVLWVTGPTGVGKSTIGFGAYLELLGGGGRAAFVDVAQIGFLGAARNQLLQARNLASVWANHCSAGADVLVVVGQVDAADTVKGYETALPNATFTWCRLHASPTELTRRVLSRRDGGSWWQPGDPLRGQPPEHLREVAQRAITEAARLDASDIGLRLDVDGLSPRQAATAVLEMTPWPKARSVNRSL